MRSKKNVGPITILLLGGWLFGVVFAAVQLRIFFEGYENWALLHKRNYLKVAYALNEYENSFGKYPDSKSWYDDIINEYNFVSEEDFLLFGENESFNIALNRNLMGKQRKDRDTVLLYQGSDEKNQAGGKADYKKSKGWVITVGGKYFEFDKDSGVLKSETESKAIQPKDLRF
ncbi:hypothetical protein [Sedimentisphaera salicampi]|uniref:Uncharacterized protein n=1 Tax=Sedimentisphaera salicampi TaxID=1941349 RepID=A0A1W6LMM1_9BACT|nr:hypothetical protein [Sedimentisphaera salicampi]ARN56996.1 hypothetical protein STSP1_01389 [Sedimentisphaera salicampi]OXU14835.1 hypothetical protein SMSP1_01330 [Sedimentisphaera salicampi]